MRWRMRIWEESFCAGAPTCSKPSRWTIIFRLLPLPLLLAAPCLGAAALDAFDYKDTAALRLVWSPQGESPMPEATLGGDQQRAMRLACPFSRLKDWRFYWDRDLKAGLGS